MKIQNAILFIVGLFFAYSVAFGATEAKNENEYSNKKITEWIQQLSSEEFEIREKATKNLMRLEERAVKPLKEAIKNSKDTELISRARKIISLYEGGGEAVKGLKLVLATDKKNVSNGDTFTFTVKLINQTQKDITLETGYTTSGNYFKSGAAFRAIKIEDVDLRQISPRWNTGFCGTGARPLYSTIPAKSSIQFTCNAVCFNPKAAANKKVQKPGEINPNLIGFKLGGKGWVTLPTEASGNQRIQVTLTSRDGGGKNPWFKKPGGEIWTGTIKSNEVKISLETSGAKNKKSKY